MGSPGDHSSVMSGMLGTTGQQLLGREPGNALSAIRRLRRELEYAEEAQVANALAQGWTWSQIGRALGVSRQAAHHKYSRCHAAALPAPGPVLAGNVRLALTLARIEASARGDVLVGTEHLLVGLFEQGEGDAAAALRRAGAGLRAMRAALDVLAPSDICSLPAAQIGLTMRASRAFERAALGAHNEGRRRISDLDLLDAVIEVPTSGAVALLRALNVDAAAVRQTVRKVRRSAPAMLSE